MAEADGRTAGIESHAASTGATEESGEVGAARVKRAAASFLLRYVYNRATTLVDASGYQAIDRMISNKHNPADLKPITPPADFRLNQLLKLEKHARRIYGEESQEYGDFLVKMGKNPPGIYAGQDVGPTLKQAAIILENDISKLSDRERSRMIDVLYSNTTSALAWDVKELYLSEKKTTFTKGKYGAGPTSSFITVNGEVHFAGAVNYWYWGRLNKLLFDGEMKSDPWRTYNIARMRFKESKSADGRTTIIVTDKTTLTRPAEKINLHKALGAMVFFRMVNQVQGSELGVHERWAWIQAGWFNDYSYASPFKLNSIIQPCPEIYPGPLTFAVGATRDRERGRDRGLRDDSSLYYKQIGPKGEWPKD